MVTADMVLLSAVVLVVVVALLAIPRMMRADEETLAALHRQQAMHQHLPTHSQVEAIHALPHDEHRHAEPRHVKHAA